MLHYDLQLSFSELLIVDHLSKYHNDSSKKVNWQYHISLELSPNAKGCVRAMPSLKCITSLKQCECHIVLKYPKMQHTVNQCNISFNNSLNTKRCRSLLSNCRSLLSYFSL